MSTSRPGETPGRRRAEHGRRPGRGPGRRPGPTETRDQIIAAARRLFAEKGYDGTSIRAVAREAGVDPALVHHFFENKEGLFVTALRFPIEPAVLLQTLLAGSRAELGERFARTFVSIWADPDSRDPLLALMRSAITTEQVATMMRQFASSAMLVRIAEATGVPPLRITGAIGQLIGAMMLRYVIRVEPMASAGDEELIAMLAPVVQYYLDDEARPGGGEAPRAGD